MKRGAALSIRDMRLSYRLETGGALDVLDVPTLDVAAGVTVGVTGPSGSGKTSLLYVLSGLEPPRSGAVVWDGCDVAALRESERDAWRRRSVGIVFQSFQLFPTMTALENVLVPATLCHWRVPGALASRARALLERVGLLDRVSQVATMSRGEMQRVAIARCLLFEPRIVVADEPTASLDGRNAELVGDVLLSVAREAGSTLVVVTHDRELLKGVDVVFTLEGGRLTEWQA